MGITVYSLLWVMQIYIINGKVLVLSGDNCGACSLFGFWVLRMLLLRFCIYVLAPVHLHVDVYAGLYFALCLYK